MRNYILLTLAILAGILAFFISKQQLDRRYAQIRAMTQTVQVVAVRRDYVAGEELQQEDLGGLEVLRSQVTDDHVMMNQDWTALFGQRLLVPLRTREPVRWSFLDLPNIGVGGNLLAQRIPEGHRALAISVDTVSSVSSMIQPNDHIDIIATFRFPPEQQSSGSRQMDLVTYTMLQDVTVLAVGQQLAGQIGSGRGYSTITLAVTPKEAERLIFAQQKGSLIFTLRPPLDVNWIQDKERIDFERFEEELEALDSERRERIDPPSSRP